MGVGLQVHGREESCSRGLGGGGTEAHFPTHLPLLVRRAGEGGIRRGGCPTCPAWGGGSTPTCMAQNDPHVALIILTTHMWGGGGAFGGKFFFGPKIVFGRLWRQHPLLHTTKGSEAHPPPPVRGASISPPPPPAHTPSPSPRKTSRRRSTSPSSGRATSTWAWNSTPTRTTSTSSANRRHPCSPTPLPQPPRPPRVPRQGTAGGPPA